MAEYIERGAALNVINENKSSTELAWITVSKIPAADVAPVVHGHWTQVDETKCRCSRCDIIALIGLYPHGDKNYCPNCGAKMDEEVNDT